MYTLNVKCSSALEHQRHSHPIYRWPCILPLKYANHLCWMHVSFDISFEKWKTPLTKATTTIQRKRFAIGGRWIWWQGSKGAILQISNVHGSQAPLVQQVDPVAPCTHISQAIGQKAPCYASILSSSPQPNKLNGNIIENHQYMHIELAIVQKLPVTKTGWVHSKKALFFWRHFNRTTNVCPGKSKWIFTETLTSRFVKNAKKENTIIFFLWTKQKKNNKIIRNQHTRFRSDVDELEWRCSADDCSTLR